MTNYCATYCHKVIEAAPHTHTHTNTHNACTHTPTNTHHTHTHAHTHSEANNLVCMVLYARSEGPTSVIILIKSVIG